MGNPLKNVKEIALIESWRRRLRATHPDVVVSIGDDTAVVKGKSGYLLYTVDMLVEGVHFLKDDDPQRIGYKALAVSISDIAAMGGVPEYALVSVGLPARRLKATAEGLLCGLSRCAKNFGLDIIGGDTNRSDKLVVDCFVIGRVKEKDLILRSGAKDGDRVFVSGPLGGSRQGKHFDFVPRLKESRFLVENFRPTSMIDLSDGLAMDMNRIAQACGLGALIFEEKIPLSRVCRTVREALYDGEDFELLFTLPESRARRLEEWMKQKKTPFSFYSIGRMTDLFYGVRLAAGRKNVRVLAPKGFQHF